MIKKIILPIVAVALFIVAVGVFVQKSYISTPTPAPTQTEPAAIINGKVIPVTVARTPQEREKGLSGVASLDKDSGMLFVFDETKIPVFWMKGMLIPLDIIWINEGKIIKIDKNVPIPSPDTPDNKINNYSSGVLIDYVLEVEAGFSDSNSIKVGDSVAFSGI